MVGGAALAAPRGLSGGADTVTNSDDGDGDGGTSEWDRLEEAQFEILLANGALTQVRLRGNLIDKIVHVFAIFYILKQSINVSLRLMHHFRFCLSPPQLTQFAQA